MSKRIAVVPGSFDPITNGHISIIEKAALMYDEVYVAVMINENKKYMFTLEQREAIAKSCFEGRENIHVISSSGWLWQLADKLGACAIVKGYRNDIDLEYELRMANFNDAHCAQAKTVLIKADDAHTDLSSTVVRNRLISGQALDDYLPQAAIEKINFYK